ncbi:hypothetical protein WOLCODRAFT_135021 [Wolfiporia cocos MD-104 SS10]|uniref:Uncharacterized protein n=1 Tax=Wolfiporia cocos (strain MD-104) TaxID=742152 RepID=A0A2H3J0F0_WOLCO|nr:hypothetical protein WOLCODRAFT_135021 [Wolfiporia cocos MD-104 SS10]
MWCTRWYLPLVLLPYPIAPPYFLWLWLFSTTLHAKPCFYCIILLSALFVSSCYWPPVPLDSPLAAPWAENVTTFADALATLVPGLPADMLPASVPMGDRCWCDLAGRGFFEPFNVTQWELDAVLRLKDDLEQQLEARNAANALAAGVNATDAGAGDAHADAAQGQPGTAFDGGRSNMLAGLWNKMLSFARYPMESDLNVSPPRSNATLDSLLFGSEDLPPKGEEQSSVEESPTPDAPQQLPLLRKEYDLRPYGFALIVDFGWTPLQS